MIIHVQLG